MLVQAGYQSITAVDVSRVVIDQMKRKYKDEGIKCTVRRQQRNGTKPSLAASLVRGLTCCDPPL